MSVAVWNCHSWPLDVSSSVKLPVLTTRCQHQGVYLIDYLGTSSHILSCSLHLTHYGGIYLIDYQGTSSHILSWSLHLTSYGGYIWQLIWVLHLKIWTHIRSWSLHLTSTGGLYLTAYLGTSSENLNSHLILVTSSDKLQGGISDSWSGYFILQVDLVEHFIWKLDLILPSILNGLSLTT